MKKSFLIIMLCVMQCACAYQAPLPRADGVLLSFHDIASEITVDIETTDTAGKDRLPADEPLGTP